MIKNSVSRTSRLLLLTALFSLQSFRASNSHAQTISTFDVLIATETLTVIGTTTLQGAGFSVGGSTFVINQGKIGVATASPAGLFTVGNGTFTILYSGLIGIGTTTPTALLHLVGPAIQGNGSQFLWIASSAALRSGEVDGSQWNPSNIGAYSVALGYDNQASAYGAGALAGQHNSVQGSGSVIGGGSYNLIYSQLSVIAGGGFNSISGSPSVIAGGQDNGATGNYASVGGGGRNIASGTGATVSGGGVLPGGTEAGNTAYGTSSALSGGVYNNAAGDYSSVPGGYNNYAGGAYSLAAGQSATAQNQGDFVWADSQGTSFVSNINDEFKIRARGGFVLYSTWTAPTVIVSSGSILISTAATAASSVPNLYISSSTGGVGIDTSTFLTGGIFHVVAPTNTHTYYDLDRLSNGYDSSLSWATNAYRRWYLGFLPSAGAANGDLVVYNSSANAVIETYQDSTGNIGVRTGSPATALDVNGAIQVGSVVKTTFTATGSIQVPYGVSAATAILSNFLQASSVTLTGASGFSLIASTGAYFNGPLTLGPQGSINYYDQTKSTTAPSNNGGGSGAVNISTCGYLPTSPTFNLNSSFMTVSGSSLTWISRGGKPSVRMKFNYVTFDGNSITNCIKVLIDSGNSGTRTQCFWSMMSPSGGSTNDGNLDVTFTSSISTGTHTVQLYAKTNDVNGTKFPNALTGDDGPQLCVFDQEGGQ